ncbi:EAL domain-containing protein [Spiribacter halobius]|uniref:Uncharacterized protein n=1 Tax=Sediminicurvatus halobius TaxID=2182432 RepID=A0A2U2MWR0_9GAMM|nr:EAL domain-containing protein [Spiribacter halobius]PWG61295.1 hypothetical protein DEM34_17145 [Spiribacter halobius]UEX78968.1 EAL domain-containing protein [Spiribacter halobius]
MESDNGLLRLLYADAAGNDVEQLTSVLRNAGLAVRATAVADAESLGEALAGHSYDLFLCADGLEELPLASAIRVLHQAGRDLPLLVLADGEEPQRRREVMAEGAVDLVSKADPEHFRLVVARELAGLHERRRIRRVEAALRETERRCHALLDSSRDAIAYVHEGMHVYANRSYLERFGVRDLDEIQGLPVLDLIASEDQDRFKTFFRHYMRGDSDQQAIDVHIQAADGEVERVHMEFSAASWDGEDCSQILIREQSSSAELEERLEDLSRKDLLTGLFNRNYFVDVLDRALAEQLDADDGSTSALLYVRLDNLEAVRATHGITVLDMVIGDVATLVERQAGGGGLAARYSDAVFTLLLRHHGVHEALAVAESIRKSVEDHVTEAGNRTITKTCSLGVAVLGDGVATAEQAINLASAACEAAAEEGGNRVQLHAGEEPEGGDDWRTLIEDALAGEGFDLYYQPLVALDGDQTERYEVSLRLRATDGEMLEPGAFLPHAERHGLAAAIDRWVLDQAAAAVAARQQRGHETTLFVRIGGASLGEQAVVEQLAETLQRLEIPGERLVLQIAESVAVTQLNQAKAFHERARALGCGFALDGFGVTGNTTQLIQHLPADYLKIARELTEDLGSNDRHQQQVRELIATGHEMGKRVIAGYLEEATVLAMLWQYQVDLVQGHFLQEPLPDMGYDFTGMVI